MNMHTRKKLLTLKRNLVKCFTAIDHFFYDTPQQIAVKQANAQPVKVFYSQAEADASWYAYKARVSKAAADVKPLHIHIPLLGFTVKHSIRAANAVTSPFTRPFVGAYRMHQWYKKRYQKQVNFIDGGKIHTR